MGMRSFTNPCWLVLLVAFAAGGQVGAPLLRPGGLAFDSVGNLYVSDSGRQVVRRLGVDGSLTVALGTGVQGTGLDSPGALAVGPAGELYVADVGNGRVLRVSTAGVVSTLLSGLGRPSGVCVDPSGDVFVSDETRQVVRRVSASGVVSTVLGTGVQGSVLDSPGPLACGAAGELYVVDQGNRRVLRVDAAGAVTTVATGAVRGIGLDGAGNLLTADDRQAVRVAGAVVAGTGVQGFSGDGAAGVAAMLDSPGAVTVSPGELVTFADVGNGRVRQIDAAGVIHTILGVGAVAAPSGLTLSGPGMVVYGTGTVSVTGGSGVASLLDGGVPIATTTLVAGAGSFSTAGLGAGRHTLTVRVGTAVSNALVLEVTAAPVVGTPLGLTVVYGTAVPGLTGSLTGVLSQDFGNVTLGLNSAAGTLSPVGSYVVSGVLSGSAAGNYALTLVPAAVVVVKAPSAVVLTSGLAVHVASGTSGAPGGSVSLLDGGAVVATAGLSAGGDAQFSSAGLSNGSHTLTARYGGDGNFLGSDSGAQVVTVGGGAAGDFALAASGPATVTVVAGSAGSFGFVETPANGGLASQIVLSVAGLPAGATASFNPAYLVPGAATQGFVMTVQTAKTTGMLRGMGVVLALLLMPLVWRRRRVVGVVALGLLVGCGDRVAAVSGAGPRSYNLTVSGTGTDANGVAVVRSVGVVLVVQ